MLIQTQLPNRSHERRGLVLLVVMAMLALFSSVAISFVFYAESEAEAARLNRIAQIIMQPEVDPEVLWAFGLNQLIYDTDNIYSAMRGWSFGGSMYGYNPGAMNYIPYNGIGRSALSYPDPDMTVDNFSLVNYQTYYNPNALPADKTVNFVRTPEYTDKVFFGPAATPPSPSQTAAGTPTYRYVGSANPPWTSYDTNSLFLAEMTADGRVLMPSFVRPWNLNALAGLTAPQQAIVRKYMSLRPDGAWHPGFSGTLPDQDGTGDVKNLDWGPGGNDSIWIDIGAPVMTAPNGKRYKPLYAFLITDLANKLHLFAHGNNVGGTLAVPPGVSGMGLGAPDVNLNYLIGNPIVSIVQAGGTQVTTANPHGLSVGQQFMVSGVSRNAFNGTKIAIAPTAGNVITFAGGPAGNLGAGGFVYDLRKLAEMRSLFALRYGPAATPIGNAPRLPVGSFATLSDGDATDGSGFSTKSYMTGFRTALTQAVPPAGLPAARTVTVAALTGGGGNAVPWAIEVGQSLSIDTGANAEVVTVTAVNYQNGTITATFTRQHPANAPVTFNNYFAFPAFPPTGGWNNSFGEMTNVPLGVSPFNPTAPNILPIPMSNQEALQRWGGTGSPALTSEIFRRMPNIFSDIRFRNMVTINNWSLDRITASPYLNYDRTGAASYYRTVAGFPITTGPNPPNAAGWPKENYLVPGSVTPGVAPNWNSEFSSDWRSNLGTQLRLDLNRALTDYPIASNNSFAPNLKTVFTAAQLQQYTMAVTDRQNFATDIYRALVRITGARDPNVVPGMVFTSSDYQAARWLAQLAVNMVDYIDNDDYMTPFNWYPTAVAPNDGWVFGTEIPRLVLNEVYAQHDTLAAGAQGSRVDVFAELQNPLLSRNAAAWTPGTNYTPGMLVTSNTPPPPPVPPGSPTSKGDIFLCTTANNANAGNAPPNGAFWQLQYPVDNGAALLSVSTPAGVPANTWPVHKLLVAKSSAPLTQDMRNPANNLGDPMFNNAPAGRKFMDTAPAINPNLGWGAPNTNSPQEVLPANGVFNTPVVPKQIAAPNNNQNLTGVHRVAPGNTVRVRTTQAHGFQVGHAVTITGVTNQGNAAQPVFEGTFVITNVLPNPSAAASQVFEYVSPVAVGNQNDGNGTVTYAGNGGNQGFYVLAPVGGRYRAANRNPTLPATYASTAMTAPLPLANILPVGPGGATEAGTTVTIRTQGAHSFVVGDLVLVEGVAPDNRYNGTWTITTVPNATSFTYTAPAAGYANSGQGTVTPANVTVVLQRLANPHMPPNNAPGPFYNPYITVDYMDRVNINNDAGAINPNTFTSVGRRQPYIAQFGQQAAPLYNSRPRNSFFQQNDVAGAPTPFTWLVHLDRAPVNPIELIHVSGVQPHQLTQQFVGNFGHCARFGDPNTLLYRFLDVVGTRYQAGLYVGGRTPGKININTITELEVFQALCDPHTGPTSRYPNAWFTQADVQSILTKIIQSRTGNPGANYAPAGIPLATTETFPQGQQRPFKSFAAGNFQDTLFRDDPAGPPGRQLFTVAAGSHPVAQSSLLQKVFNNITTTSDSFAVWCTVGYFEVLDETVRPVRLGAEVGRSENRHIRHRFFSIIDRTGLQLFNTNSTNAVTGTTLPWLPSQQYAPPGGPFPSFVLYNGIIYQCTQPNSNQPPPPNNPASWSRVTMTLNAPFRTTDPSGAGLVNGLSRMATLEPGMLLEIDSGGANAEVVAVQALPGSAPWNGGANYVAGSIVLFGNMTYVCIQGNSGTPPPNPAFWRPIFVAPFTQSHGNGASVLCRGNPGPTTNYNPRRDTNVVLHLSVIN